MRPAAVWCPFSLVLVLSLLAALPSPAQDSNPLLNPVFQDHVVLQRNEPVQVWGSASPGDTVRVTLAGTSASAVATEDGQWTAELASQTAGGPHRLVATSSGGRVQTISDVLVGDVYLCSGQSNMELPVDRTLNTRAVISEAANDRIRMMTVDRAYSAAPQQTLPTPLNWEVASPETVPDWSATCYYFARDLQEHEDVPLGLLHSSWGGTSITAWMSRDALSRAGDYANDLSLLDQYAKSRRTAQQTFGERWETWWQEATGTSAHEAPWQPQTGAQWSQAPDSLRDWKTWGDPALSDFTGMVWHRTTVSLTAEQAQHDGVLFLGRIDAVDQTWVNGEIVGNTFGWGTPRTYTIPASHLQEGQNVIVVNVLNDWGQGGMLPAPPSRSLLTGTGDQLDLSTWHYKKGSNDVGSPPRTPWEPITGLSTLHNAMLAPLHDYSLRGVLWYQGESDTGMGRDYLNHLNELKAQWRSQFGENLPVLVVQLANYGSPPTSPTESSWAEVREAQRLATQHDPNAGLAVTIDIGSPYDIHPANKQEVGRRLARTSRHVIYGEDVTTGPAPSQVTREDDAVVVQFDEVSDALVAYSHTRPIGFELCGESGTCHYAEARIDGTRVRLTTDELDEVRRVRYCWADSPVCTLFDEAGLPVTPFEMDISSGSGAENAQ
jgi:sialate O-acetylesterase